MRILLCLVFIVGFSLAQKPKIVYDKKFNFSEYTSFTIVDNSNVNYSFERKSNYKLQLTEKETIYFHLYYELGLKGIQPSELDEKKLTFYLYISDRFFIPTKNKLKSNHLILQISDSNNNLRYTSFISMKKVNLSSNESIVNIIRLFLSKLIIY